MRVVLDTNVLFSGSFWKRKSFEVMRLIERKKVECFISKEILKEYYSVVHRKEINEKIKEKRLFLNVTALKVFSLCNRVEPQRKLNVVREDPNDNKILECALEAKADYVITLDKKHLLKLKQFEGIKIISPTEFLNTYS